MNRLVLSATLVERKAPRYTPAGLSALDISVKHESVVSEDGQARLVAFEMKAVAIGVVTRQLAPLEMGCALTLGGFITSTRNGRGLLFHITSVEPAAEPEPAPTTNPSGSN
jgi:primosomal replication protein N